MAFARTEKKGHVLYVTITRPEVFNALHAPANLELDGIWDGFAADEDAWVAVLTGEGDRSFSAGNDLKYTAEMSRLPADQLEMFYERHATFFAGADRLEMRSVPLAGWATHALNMRVVFPLPT